MVEYETVETDVQNIVYNLIKDNLSASFSDVFTSNALKPEWVKQVGSGSIEVINGNLELNNGGVVSTGINDAVMVINKVSNFTDFDYRIHATQRSSGNTEWTFNLIAITNEDLSSYVIWGWGGGGGGTIGIWIYHHNGADVAGEFTFPLLPRDYLRMRRVGDTIYFEDSADGVNWTTKTSYSTPVEFTPNKFVIVNTCLQDSTSYTFKVDECYIKYTSDKQATVLDGRPDQLMKGIGFPYVLVHSPERGQEEMMTNTMRKIPISLTLEIFASDKESIVRTLAGQVFGILRNNKTITRGKKVFKYIVNTSALNIDVNENDKKIFSIVADVTYEVYINDIN